MEKSKSFNTFKSFRKDKQVTQSFSESNLTSLLDKSLQSDKFIRIDFEGDGPLGILFINTVGKAVVNGATSGTVASEFIELKEGYIVSKINNLDCEKLSFRETLKLIARVWKEMSVISIEFIKPSDEIIEINKSCPVYLFLQENNCEEYYQKFIDLGAVSLVDFEYVEYQDLINMQMKIEHRRILHKVLKFDKKSSFKKIPSEVFTELDDIETYDI